MVRKILPTAPVSIMAASSLHGGKHDGKAMKRLLTNGEGETEGWGVFGERLTVPSVRGLFRAVSRSTPRAVPPTVVTGPLQRELEQRRMLPLLRQWSTLGASGISVWLQRHFALQLALSLYT